MPGSGGKPSEKPQPRENPKPRPFHFHCGYCGKDGHQEEFCYRKRKDERRAKEWANKDRYRPSCGVPEPRVESLPRGKGFVRSFPTHGARSFSTERESMRGEQRSGLTRTGTALLVLCLSLV